MLKIENLLNIEGKEFQLGNGTKYIIGITNEYTDHYSFGVFELDDRNVANISTAIVFELHKKLFDYGSYKGYLLSSSKMKKPARVRQSNITLENFVLELHIQTGMIVNNRI